MTNRYAVSVRNLHKSFPGTDALSGVNLDIEKGIILGLLGPNGSGKSSLLKCIAGLFHPSKGEVLVMGEKPGRRTKEKVSFMPEIDHIYPWMKVGEVLNFVSAFYDDWQSDRAEELLNFMNLERHSQVGKMSKGMRARLRLIIALARKTPIVLLDEPLSGIDPPSRSRIVKAIVSQHAPGEQTIVLSTHDVADAESIFDNVVLLEKGKIKLTGNADQLRQEHNCSIQALLEEVYA